MLFLKLSWLATLLFAINVLAAKTKITWSVKHTDVIPKDANDFPLNQFNNKANQIDSAKADAIVANMKTWSNRKLLKHGRYDQVFLFSSSLFTRARLPYLC